MRLWIVVSHPGAHSGAYDDCVYVSPHRVLHIGWHKDKTPRRITLRPLFVWVWPDGKQERARDDCDPGILVV